MRWHFFQSLFLFLWLFSPLLAQNTPSEETDFTFTLQECIDYAIKHNVVVQRSKLNVLADQVALKQSKADLLPSIGASSSVSYSVGRTINQFSNEYVDQPVRQQSVNVGAEVILFNSFRKLNTIKLNKNNIEISQSNLEATENDITLNVIEAYTQILYNQELLNTTRLQLQNTELQLGRTRKLVQAGSLPSADVLQLEAQQANDELQIVNAENNLALARLQLKQILQIPDSQSLEIVTPEVAVPEEEALPASATFVYQQAVQTLPSIRSADLQITSAQYNVAINKAGYYPSLTLSAALFSSYSSVAPDQIPKAGTENITRIIPTSNFIIAPPGIPGVPEGTQVPVFTETEIPSEFTDNTYLNQLDFNLRRYVSLNLNIPIFNNWQAKTNVSNAYINLDDARLNAIDQRNQLRQTIEQAYLDAKSAAKSYVANQKRVTSLQEAFRNTEIRYQAGGIEVVDYNQAKNDLNTAESDLIRSKYQYVFSLKVLDFYQGKSLDF